MEVRAPDVRRLREDLVHLPPVVAVDQDAERPQRLDRDVGRAQARGQHVVVARRRHRELDAAAGEGPDRAHDVLGQEREVLHPGAVVPGQEVIDLARLAAEVRLDDRERDAAGRALHHLGHHALVADLDVLLERDREAEHLLVEGDGGVEFAGRHAHRRVVDEAQQVVGRSGGGARLHLDRTGLELGVRAAAFDEAVDHVAEARNLRGDDAGLVVFPGAGLADARSAGRDRVGVGGGGAVGAERGHGHAVAVPGDELAGGMVFVQPRGQQYPDVALAEQDAALPRQPRVRAAVAVDAEAVGGAQGLRRRDRITHVELDVVDVEDLHRFSPLRFMRFGVVPGGRAGHENGGGAVPVAVGHRQVDAHHEHLVRVRVLDQQRGHVQPRTCPADAYDRPGQLPPRGQVAGDGVRHGLEEQQRGNPLAGVHRGGDAGRAGDVAEGRHHHDGGDRCRAPAAERGLRRARAATSASSGLKLDSMNPASGGTSPSASASGQDADDRTVRPAAAAAACSAARPGDARDAWRRHGRPTTSAVFAPPNAALRLIANSAVSGKRLVQHEAEAASVVGAEEPGVDREHALARRQQRDDQLQHAGRLQGLAVQRLGGADRHGLGGVAEREPQRVRLGRVARAVPDPWALM